MIIYVNDTCFGNLCDFDLLKIVFILDVFLCIYKLDKRYEFATLARKSFIQLAKPEYTHVFPIYVDLFLREQVTREKIIQNVVLY